MYCSARSTFSRLASCAVLCCSSTSLAATRGGAQPILAFAQPPYSGAPRPFFNLGFARNMAASSDEVAKAQEAAKVYEASDKDGAGPSTVFDKLLSGEWSCDKLFEDDKCLAFRDINPQAPVHFLVIPKKRDGLTQLCKAREDQKDLLGHLLYVAQELGQKECPEGYRITINDGKDGAQSVYHLHLHVMGGRQMEWPPG